MNGNRERISSSFVLIVELLISKNREISNRQIFFSIALIFFYIVGVGRQK